MSPIGMEKRKQAAKVRFAPIINPKLYNKNAPKSLTPHFKANPIKFRTSRYVNPGNAKIISSPTINPNRYNLGAMKPLYPG